VHLEIRTSPQQVDLAISQLEGFREFIGAWVVETSRGVIIVDPGPDVTIPILVHELELWGIKKLSAILLTHIHVDHAGGTAALVKRFPMTPVVAHSRIHKHLVDPTELIRGSVRVLGESLMSIYGPIRPVPSELLRSAELGGWGAIPTPGHSSDHISYLIDDTIFIGEALGNTTPDSSQFYLRPATPPRFFFDVYTNSIKAIQEKVTGLERVKYCFGHFGIRDEHIDALLCLPQIALAQIGLWVDTVRKHSEEPVEAIVDLLLEVDTYFAAFKRLPLDIQAREIIFIKNSVRGILGSLPTESERVHQVG